jgi:hypothetical protein
MCRGAEMQKLHRCRGAEELQRRCSGAKVQRRWRYRGAEKYREVQ